MGYITSVIASVWRLFERVTPIALLLAIAALLFQAVAAELQAMSTSWQLLTSDTKGSAGKVYALEYLNSDNMKPELSIAGFKVRFEWPFQMPPLIKERARLDGIDLSSDGASTTCPDTASGRVLIQGVNLEKAIMNGANLRCVNFSGLLNEGRDDDEEQDGKVDENNSGGEVLNEPVAEKPELNRSVFFRAKLYAADFSGSILDNAVFAKTKFQYANFEGARIRERDVGVNFCRSQGSGSAFIDVDFGNAARFTNAMLRSAKFRILEPQLEPKPESERKAAPEKHETRFDPRVQLDFRGADLNGAEIGGVEIAANFSEGTASTTLDGADLRYVSWGESDFTGASLKGTKFAGADLSDTKGISTLAASQIDEYTILPEKFVKLTKEKLELTESRYALSAIGVNAQSQETARPAVFTGTVAELGPALAMRIDIALGQHSFRVLISDVKIEREWTTLFADLTRECEQQERAGCQFLAPNEAGKVLGAWSSDLIRNKTKVKCVIPPSVRMNREIGDKLAAATGRTGQTAGDVAVGKNLEARGWCMRVVPAADGLLRIDKKPAKNVLLAQELKQFLQSKIDREPAKKTEPEPAGRNPETSMKPGASKAPTDTAPAVAPYDEYCTSAKQ